MVGSVSKADISNIWEHRVTPHRCWATISLKLMGKAFFHRVWQLGPQPTFSHLKLGTAVATEYHKHVPNVPATALHFSDMKESLLQWVLLSFLSSLKSLERRQMDIWQICHTGNIPTNLFRNSWHYPPPPPHPHPHSWRTPYSHPLLGSHWVLGKYYFRKWMRKRNP